MGAFQTPLKWSWRKQAYSRFLKEGALKREHETVAFRRIWLKLRYQWSGPPLTVLPRGLKPFPCPRRLPWSRLSPGAVSCLPCSTPIAACEPSSARDHCENKKHGKRVQPRPETRSGARSLVSKSGDPIQNMPLGVVQEQRGGITCRETLAFACLRNFVPEVSSTTYVNLGHDSGLVMSARDSSSSAGSSYVPSTTETRKNTQRTNVPGRERNGTAFDARSSMQNCYTNEH